MQWRVQLSGWAIGFVLTTLSADTTVEAISGQRQIDLTSMLGGTPHLGKGQQLKSLPPLHYALDGRPVEAASNATLAQIENRATLKQVSTAQELMAAINSAKAGDIIQLSPGLYQIREKVRTQRPGYQHLPILVRAAQPNQVVIELFINEGFNVSHAFWVFENLHIRGACASHYQCEHAFHVVGKARSVVIRNNLIEDFNAHLKINGQDGDWPDQGLVQFNTIANSQPRRTDSSVTLIDIVGASEWVLADNVISNFVKDGSNRISYGAFFKGAGTGGRMERNLVICTTKDISQTGNRVGLSLGGGGTGKAYCRDQRCDHEHVDGVIVNNIITHCNDSGIDTNQAQHALIAHNTLINTGGITSRRGSQAVNVFGNLMEGKIRTRDSSEQMLDMNELSSLSKIFDAPDTLNLAWRNPPANVLLNTAVLADFCGAIRLHRTLPGAFSSPGAATSCQSTDNSR